MKKNFTIILLLALAFTFAQVGINTTTPQNTLDINGWLKIADQNSLNGIKTEGAIRYNSVIKRLEVCDGVTWKVVGIPTIQKNTLIDGVIEGQNGTAHNYFDFRTVNNGFTTIKPFTVNNVPPNSRVLFLIEIALENGTKRASGFNNYRINGGGIDLQYECPAAGVKDVTSFFISGVTNNTTVSNLVFNFTCNQKYCNTSITTIIF